MNNRHARNTVRYYILLIVFIAFLFFSSDFGLLDVQKTAIIMSVGIDREETGFIVTSQVAIPQSSKQGKATEAVQIVSRGKTVADAFEEINAKTGWYPKLVFCNLILLGEKTCEENVFDVLDYFLRDEYLSSGCLVAACDGYAKDLLNVTPLVDPSSGVAIGKVLSRHASRVGTVLTSSLRSFAIGYFGDSKSGYLPLVKTQPQQEEVGGANPPNQDAQPSGGQNQQQQSQGSEQNQGSNQPTDKPVFSAEETALFVNGKRVGKLTAEETFAFSAVKNELRLAPYLVKTEEAYTTLTVKQNAPKSSLKVGEDGSGLLEIKLTVTAGILDNSKSVALEALQDAGDVPPAVFHAAQQKLSASIKQTFEKTRSLQCDIFGVGDMLAKYQSGKRRHQAELLDNTHAEVTVKFENVR